MIEGHIRERCESRNCRRCESGGHTAGLCQGKAKTWLKCNEVGHIEKECLTEPEQSDTNRVIEQGIHEPEPSKNYDLDVREKTTQKELFPDNTQIKTTTDIDKFQNVNY